MRVFDVVAMFNTYSMINHLTRQKRYTRTHTHTYKQKLTKNIYFTRSVLHKLNLFSQTQHRCIWL